MIYHILMELHFNPLAYYKVSEIYLFLQNGKKYSFRRELKEGQGTVFVKIKDDKSD